jgi:hypothetical protein
MSSALAAEGCLREYKRCPQGLKSLRENLLFEGYGLQPLRYAFRNLQGEVMYLRG